MHFAITTLSLLGLTLSASAAAVPTTVEKRTTDFWQLVAKPVDDSTAAGIPLILGVPYDNDAGTYLSTSDPTETLLCSTFESVLDWDGNTLTGMKVVNHPSVTQDVWAWKTIGAKFLYTSIWMDITGTRGNWSFVQDANSSDELLALNGNTVAGYQTGVSGSAIFFGDDVPSGEYPITWAVLVKVPVSSC